MFYYYQSKFLSLRLLVSENIHGQVGWRSGCCSLGKEGSCLHCRMKVLRGKLGKYQTPWHFMLANSGGLKVSWQNVSTLNSCALLVKVLDFINGAPQKISCLSFCGKKTHAFSLRTHTHTQIINKKQVRKCEQSKVQNKETMQL